MPRWSAERRASLKARGADASRKSVPRVPLATARNAVRPAHCAGSARTERLSALHPLAAGEGHTPSFRMGGTFQSATPVGFIADRTARHCHAPMYSAPPARQEGARLAHHSRAGAGTPPVHGPPHGGAADSRVLAI